MSLPPIKGAKLSRKTVNKLKQKYKWAIFTIGRAKISVTQSGGIHSSGKKTDSKSVFFEIRRSSAYIGIALIEYPNGVVFHSYISINDMDGKNKSKLTDSVIEPIYNEIAEILKED